MEALLVVVGGWGEAGVSVQHQIMESMHSVCFTPRVCVSVCVFVCVCACTYGVPAS